MPTLKASIISSIDKHLYELEYEDGQLSYLDMKGYDHSIEYMNEHGYTIEYDGNAC